MSSRKKPESSSGKKKPAVTKQVSARTSANKKSTKTAGKAKTGQFPTTSATKPKSARNVTKVNCW